MKHSLWLRFSLFFGRGLFMLGHGGSGGAQDKKGARPDWTVVKAGKESKNTGSVIVPKILEASWVMEEKNPPNLLVKAKGEVPTAGYSNEQLTRAVYVMPPADGIQDYFLTAKPPEGMAAQVISTVEASNRWDGIPKWVRGIRIHGVGDGVVEIRFRPNPK
jgi:hypothetical protein